MFRVTKRSVSVNITIFWVWRHVVWYTGATVAAIKHPYRYTRLHGVTFCSIGSQIVFRGSVEYLLVNKKLLLPTKPVTVFLIKVQSCNALLRMLLVGISIYLKSVLRHKFLILVTYYTRSPFVSLLSRRAQYGRWSSFGKRVWFTESHIILIVFSLMFYLFIIFLI
jgi:hypothetical protein